MSRVALYVIEQPVPFAAERAQLLAGNQYAEIRTSALDGLQTAVSAGIEENFHVTCQLCLLSGRKLEVHLPFHQGSLHAFRTSRPSAQVMLPRRQKRIPSLDINRFRGISARHLS